MKNKTYLKASLREIRQSKGRFIAITLIIFLGTFLFVGVKATGPILNHSASEYVNGRSLGSPLLPFISVLPNGAMRMSAAVS